MKRESKLLLAKACDSLVLSIELFNRPQERGRITSTLIQIDHAFEMLLKAAILAKGGKIREKRAKQTIGFDACIRRGLSDGKVKFLIEEQALLLQTINGLRDAAQHHLLEMCEGQLYIQMQSGVTLFRDLMKSVFDQDLKSYLPARVLPISTMTPTDITTLFESEVSEIKKLLKPGRRKRLEALARLRPLAIMDSTIRGDKDQPSEADLGRLSKSLVGGEGWETVFSGAAAVDISAEGSGPNITLRLSKKEGVPVQLVAEGTPGASVVGVKRVDELGYYNLSLNQLAEKLKLTAPRTLAVVRHLKIQDDAECFKVFVIGSQMPKRYSQNALRKLKDALPGLDMDEVWEAHKPPGRK